MKWCFGLYFFEVKYFLFEAGYIRLIIYYIYLLIIRFWIFRNLIHVLLNRNYFWVCYNSFLVDNFLPRLFYNLIHTFLNYFHLSYLILLIYSKALIFYLYIVFLFHYIYSISLIKIYFLIYIDFHNLLIFFLFHQLFPFEFFKFNLNIIIKYKILYIL